MKRDFLNGIKVIKECKMTEVRPHVIVDTHKHTFEIEERQRDVLYTLCTVDAKIGDIPRIRYYGRKDCDNLIIEFLINKNLPIKPSMQLKHLISIYIYQRGYKFDNFELLTHSLKYVECAVKMEQGLWELFENEIKELDEKFNNGEL